LIDSEFDFLKQVGNVAKMEHIRNGYEILIEVPSKYPTRKSWTQKVHIDWGLRYTECENYR
jgi:hypothetical protein